MCLVNQGMLRKFSNIALLLLLGLYYNSVPILWFSYSTFAQKVFVEHCVNPENSKCKGKCQVMAMQTNGESSNQDGGLTLKLPQFHPPFPTSSIDFSARNHSRLRFISCCLGLSLGIHRLPFLPPKFSA